LTFAPSVWYNPLIDTHSSRSNKSKDPKRFTKTSRRY
jgi:hypothetical protein